MSGLIVGPVAFKIGGKVYRENIFVAPISFQMLLGGDILNNRGETETVVFLKSRVLFFDGQSMELMSLGAEEDQVGEVSLEERRWIPPDSDVRVAAKLSTESREDYVIEPTHESKVGFPQVVRKGDTEPVGCRVNIRSRRNWEKKRKSRKDKLKDVECACVDLSGPGMGDSWGWLLSEGPGLDKEDLQVFGEMDLDSEKFVYSTNGGVDCEGLPNGVCEKKQFASRIGRMVMLAWTKRGAWLGAAAHRSCEKSISTWTVECMEDVSSYTIRRKRKLMGSRGSSHVRF